MKAVIYREFSGPLAIETLPDPEPSAGGVVIEVKATGLCRSDWHGWKGHDPDIRLPHVRNATPAISRSVTTSSSPVLRTGVRSPSTWPWTMPM